MGYRDNLIYTVLEELVKAAGVNIIYQEVPNDQIDGEIWARADYNMNAIMMPDADDAFPDDDTACLILGHEMGHIMMRVDSPDDPSERRMNEAVCDQIGVYLYKLACMIAEKKMEDAFNEKRNI